MSMSIGKKIRLIRENLGLSQAKFAQLTDIPKISLQGYEMERSGISEANLLKITTHPQLKHYALWLVSGTDHEDEVAALVQETPPEYFSTDRDFAQQLHKHVAKLDDDKKKQVTEFAKFLSNQANAQKND